MKQLRFTLLVRPTTKKTSNRIAGMGKRCHSCGKSSIQRVLPSEQFEEFEKTALVLGMQIIPKLRQAGAVLPITKPVHIKALFYRDRDAGDWTGFTNALADVLQGERYTVECPKCKRGRKIGMETLQGGQFRLECLGCGHEWTGNAMQAKLSRRGLGIIADDELIEHWDGTRLLLDKARPRIEIEINIIPPVQGELL
jgi:hypothetical protein